MSASKLSMKLLIDQKTNKVLFAEADKETIDFLFSILTLPVSTVISLLSEQGMVGCLANLYNSVEGLKKEYVQNDHNKGRLLKPKVHTVIKGSHLGLLKPKVHTMIKGSHLGLLKPKVHTMIKGSHLFLLADDVQEQPKKKRKVVDKTFYRCNTRNGHYCTGCGSYKVHHYVTDNPLNACPECRGLMNIVVPFVGTREEVVVEAEVDASGGSGFVKKVVTYMVMDDLVVKPMSTISSIALLKKMNVKDVGVLEEKVVDMDINKGLKLLKMAFQSKNVLSSVFLS